MASAFLGHTPWEDIPFFPVSNQDIQAQLNLPADNKRYSYRLLYALVYEQRDTNISLLKNIITYYFLKNYQSAPSPTAKMELTDLQPGVWVELVEDKLMLLETPHSPLWNFLEPGRLIYEDPLHNAKNLLKKGKKQAEALSALLKSLSIFSALEGPTLHTQANYEALKDSLTKQGFSGREILSRLESQFPLAKQLHEAGSTFKMLPSRYQAGEWISLKALKLKLYDPQKRISWFPFITLLPLRMKSLKN